ncbi:glycosyltransferase family 2 protein [bacterium]|nr:MAG: glycosyltransferase family 2 protein [bacterium]
MSPRPQLRFFAVVLNWRRAEDTRRTIESLQKAGLRDERIIVVDNESSPDEMMVLSQTGEKVVVLPERENLGYAGGNNVGLRYAIDHGADAILVLNNDAEVAPDVFQQWETAFSSGERIGIVGAAVFDSDNGHLNNLGLDEGGAFVRDETLLECDLAPAYAPHGCAMVLRAAMLREIGLLDERLFLMGEETDLAERARLAGWKILVAPKARVKHEGGASFGGISPLKVYYSHRNTLLKWMNSLERGGAKAAGALEELRSRYEKASQQLVVHWVRQRKWAQAFAVAIARHDALRGRWGRRQASATFDPGAVVFVVRSIIIELKKRSRGKKVSD